MTTLKIDPTEQCDSVNPRNDLQVEYYMNIGKPGQIREVFLLVLPGFTCWKPWLIGQFWHSAVDVAEPKYGDAKPILNGDVLSDKFAEV